VKYDELTPYQKRCLVPTNFWRIVNEMPLIEVPRENTEYWTAWESGRMEARAKEILIKRNKLNL
jgi:hypothetical protein